ncbi:hypothetical protein D3C83_118020 [compost metagenome]
MRQVRKAEPFLERVGVLRDKSGGAVGNGNEENLGPETPAERQKVFDGALRRRIFRVPFVTGAPVA